MSKVLNKCVLDLDGVLADFVTGASIAHGRPNPYLDRSNYGNYYMEKIWGMSVEEFWRPMDEDFWSMLDIMDKAVDLVDFLDNEFDGNVCILSSPSKNRGCVDGKLHWIKQNFPQLERSFLIGPKKHFCASSQTLLIDDYDRNVNGFREHSGHAYLVPRPWNSAHTEDFDLDDLMEYIDDINYSLAHPCKSTSK